MKILVFFPFRTVHHFIFLSSLSFCGFPHMFLENAGRAGVLWELRYGFLFSSLTHGVSFHSSPGSDHKLSLQHVRSQLEHLFRLEWPLLSEAALSEFAGLLMWCWNLFLLDSYSWFWSAFSKEEVSISTVPNVLWRYIFMTTQLIALFVLSGVWLLNKHSHSCESRSDFIARLGFAKTRKMRRPNWISGWNTLIYAR